MFGKKMTYPGGHNVDMFRWRRLAQSKTPATKVQLRNGEIEQWMKRVEMASEFAVSEVFSLKKAPSGIRSQTMVLENTEQLQDHDEAYTEAQALLGDWMNRKLRLELEMEEDDLIGSADRSSPAATPPALPAHLNYSNFDDLYSHLAEEEESCAVNNFLQDLMEREVLDSGTAEDLTLDSEWEKKRCRDPRIIIEERHRQVRDNRARRDTERERQQREREARRKAREEAQRRAQQEERSRRQRARQQEDMVQQEVVRLRRQMVERRSLEQQARQRERQRLDMKKSAVTPLQPESGLPGSPQQQDRERLHRQQKAEARFQILHLKCLQRHFSAWCSVLLERRVCMGKAAALSDWRRQLRAWRGWRALVWVERRQREAERTEAELRMENRHCQVATESDRRRLLRRCLHDWWLWCRTEKERRELLAQQEDIRRKMAALINVAASKKPITTGPLASEPIMVQPEAPDQSETTDQQGHQRSQPVVPAPTSACQGVGPSGTKAPPTQAWQGVGPSGTKAPPTQAWQGVGPSGTKAPPTQAWQGVGPSGTKAPPTQACQGVGPSGTKAPPTQAWQGVGPSGTKAPPTQAWQGVGPSGTKAPPTQAWQVTRRYAALSTGEVRRAQEKWEEVGGGRLEHRHASQQQIIQEQRRLLQEQQEHIAQLQEQKSMLGLKQEAQRAAQLLQRAPPVAARPQGLTSDPKEPRVGSVPGGNTVCSAHRNPSAHHPCPHPTVMAMEERASQRAKRRREVEEMKRKKDEEKLAQMKAAEEKRQREREEEKHEAMERRREERRQQREREQERRRRLEQEQQLRMLAQQHHHRTLLLRRGLAPWKRLVNLSHDNAQLAGHHHRHSLLRRCILSWQQVAGESLAQKQASADQLHQHFLLRRGLCCWKRLKDQREILEGRAERFHHTRVLRRALMALLDHVTQERLVGWERQQQAQKHSDRRALQSCFLAWRQLPRLQHEERQAELRRQQLRLRVAEVLPDFRSSREALGTPSTPPLSPWEHPPLLR